MDEDDDCFPKPGDSLFEPLNAELVRAFATPDDDFVAFDAEEFLERMRRKHLPISIHQ